MRFLHSKVIFHPCIVTTFHVLHIFKSTDAGPGVTKFKAGDTVGVGYFVDSCRSCGSCGAGHENYCPRLVLASNGVDRDGAITKGGFSDVLVVNQDYVVRVPESLPPDGAAPASRCTARWCSTRSTSRVSTSASSASGA